MKKYERILMRIDDAIRPCIYNLKTKKRVVINLQDVLKMPFNQSKPYLGDYYASDEDSDQNSSIT